MNWTQRFLAGCLVPALALAPASRPALAARAAPNELELPESRGISAGLAARSRSLEALASYLAGDDDFRAVLDLAARRDLPDAPLGAELREGHEACGPARLFDRTMFVPARVGARCPFFLYDPRSREYSVGGVLGPGEPVEALVRRTDATVACTRRDGRVVFVPERSLVLVPNAPRRIELRREEVVNPFQYRKFMAGQALLHLVEADLAATPFSVAVSPYYDALHPGPERTLYVDELARRAGATVAVNGTFFNMLSTHQLYGLPIGSFIGGGALVYSLDSPSLNAFNRSYAAFTDTGRLVFGETTLPGAEILRRNLAGTFDPERLGSDRIRALAGGFGWLVKDADPEAWKAYAGKQFDPSFYSRTSRRARSLLGRDATGRRLFFLAEEEGTASPVPMSLPELAEYLVASTTYRDVLFLDGGGSTQLVIDGANVSNPMNDGSYRRNSSALLLMGPRNH